MSKEEIKKEKKLKNKIEKNKTPDLAEAKTATSKKNKVTTETPKKTKKEITKKTETTKTESTKSKKEIEKKINSSEKFAIIKTGGKQYKVTEGFIIDIEYIDSKPKEKIEFNEVLLIHSKAETKIGTPYLKNTKVTGSIINQIKAPKTLVFKFKRKTGYKKTQGHRQLMTTVKIEKI